MLFTTLPFLAFFAFFFILYWLVFKNSKTLQNGLILIGSYIFYCFTDWRFLALLIGITALNYLLAIQIEKTKIAKTRRFFVALALFQGIGGLFLFKYFNFFITSFNSALSWFDIGFNLSTLNIIIPLGISYFTFKTISYILDVDKGKIKASKDWLSFFSYVSFFPTLLSGPIDKARDFLPQLERKRVFNYSESVDGLKEILWGFFKKMVIADNCAYVVDSIFENYQAFPASSLIIGMFLYTIQVYADFSGYSHMAIGFSRLLGFKVAQNFNNPFFAQNLADFWRRWHMSLTTWVTEYVYTPLSLWMRDYGNWGVATAIVINMVVIGMWHGANWTFIVFGLIHGVLFIPIIVSGKLYKSPQKTAFKIFPSLSTLLKMMAVFGILMATFIIFKAESLTLVGEYYSHLFSSSVWAVPAFENDKTLAMVILLAFLLLFFMIVEWIGREQAFSIRKIGATWPRLLRWTWYSFILFLIGMYAHTEESGFIYFQF